MNLVLDDWQLEILEHRGDIGLCKGRRIGGTEIFAIKAAERMVSDPGTKIVMLSLTEDQAKLIVIVALEHLERFHKKLIATGLKKPTQGSITLRNGSTLKIRPVGATGDAVRGFDGDILGIDEAPWQPKMMWAAARPVITTNAGEIWMWGTPNGKQGYFWEQFNKSWNKKDPDARFRFWYKNSEEVLFNRPISESWTQKQHDGAIRILAEEKKDMSDLEYGQEYLGLFLEDINQFFDDELIEFACTEEKDPKRAGDRYLGVDIGRMYDPSAFEDVVKVGETVYHCDSQTTVKTRTTETQQKIIEMDNAVNYIQIGIDAGSGALGVGVYDNLLLVDSVKSKLEPMNNRAIALDRDGNKKQTLQKIDYYHNLRAMMQNGEIKLLKDQAVKESLRSVRWTISKEEDSSSKMQILGNNTHITEGLIRAAWLAKKGKGSNIWIDWI